LPNGRLLYRLKKRWRGGTSHVIFTPLELVEKLAALVPPPRFNLVRYSRVLAPGARWWPIVIPAGAEASPEAGEASWAAAMQNCSLIRLYAETVLPSFPLA